MVLSPLTLSGERLLQFQLNLNGTASHASADSRGNDYITGGTGCIHHPVGVHANRAGNGGNREVSGYATGADAAVSSRPRLDGR